MNDELILEFGSNNGIELDFDSSTGVTNYEALTNKPSIEGVTLIKNKTFAQLGLEPMTPNEIDEIIFG